MSDSCCLILSLRRWTVELCQQMAEPWPQMWNTGTRSKSTWCPARVCDGLWYALPSFDCVSSAFLITRRCHLVRVIPRSLCSNISTFTLCISRPYTNTKTGFLIQIYALFHSHVSCFVDTGLTVLLCLWSGSDASNSAKSTVCLIKVSCGFLWNVTHN